MSWTWKSGRTSSGPRALGRWLCSRARVDKRYYRYYGSTMVHSDTSNMRAGMVASDQNDYVHCTQRSVRAEGAGPGDQVTVMCQ